MQTSFQNYFWLVDRLQIDDDPRNKVNSNSQTVTLNEEMKRDIKNGYLVGKLLKEMQGTYMKRTGLSFELDKGVASESRNNNQQRWTVLIPALKDFGIQLNDIEKRKLLTKGDLPTADKLITQLFDIDNRPQGNGQLTPINELTPGGGHNNTNQTPKNGNGVLPSQIFGPATQTLDPISEPLLEGDPTALIGSPNTQAQNQNQIDLNIPQSSVKSDLGALNALGKNNYNNETRAHQNSNHQLLKSSKDNGSLAHLQESPKGSGRKAYGSRRVGENGVRIRGSGQSLINAKRNLSQLKYQDKKAVSPREINLPQSLRECLTSAQFIMKSLTDAFEMRPSQVSALIADNHRYLYHICIKGLKGGNFEAVYKWYGLIQEDAAQLASLLQRENESSLGQMVSINNLNENKQNQSKSVFKTLNILKSGLYSRDEGVVMATTFAFHNILSEFNKYDEIVGQAWEWFTSSTFEPVSLPTTLESPTSQKRKANTIRASQDSKFSKNKTRLSTETKKGLLPPRGQRSGQQYINNHTEQSQKDSVAPNEFLEILAQNGFQACYQAFSTHENLLEPIGLLILEQSRFNSVDLFTQRMTGLLPMWTEQATFIQNLMQATKNEPLYDQIIRKTEIVSFWVLQALKVAESPSQISLDDRMISLVLLTDVWLTETFVIDSQIQGANQAILNILKRAARDVKLTLSNVAIQLLFNLLEQFATIRHPFAPTLYKTLTFILVEFYWEQDIREIMLRNFTQLFLRENIPVAILAEPLLKQAQISQFQPTAFNVFDFEFFRVLASHEKLNVQTGVLLMDLLTKISISNIFYAKVSIQITLALIMRFSKSPELLIHWRSSFRQVTTSVVNIETRICQHNLAKKEPKDKMFNRLASQERERPRLPQLRGENITSEMRMSDAEFVAVKNNQRLIVNMLEKVINLGNELLNEELREQLIDAYIAIESQLQIQSKAIRHLLSLYAFDIDAQISKRIEVQQELHTERLKHEKVQQEQRQKQQSPALLIEQSPSPVPREEGENQHQIQDLQNSYTARLLNDQSPPIPNIMNKSPTGSELYLINQLEGSQGISPRRSPINQHNHPKFSNRQSQRQIVNNLRNNRQTRSVSTNAPSMQAPIQLYDYQGVETKPEVLRYRLFIKRHQKLYRELFQRYAGKDVGKQNVNKKQNTFDQYDKKNLQISQVSLTAMIRDFDIGVGASGVLSSVKLRQNVPSMIKLINQFVFDKQTGIEMLHFEGFVEFLLQHAHQVFNVENSKRGVVSQKYYPNKALQLAEKVFELIKSANISKNLLISKRYFEETLYPSSRPQMDDVRTGGGTIGGGEHAEILELLNQKVTEDPNYQVPSGFKKVQQILVEDNFGVPEVLNFKESEKIALELLDELFSKSVGVHILQPIPIKKTLVKVKVDQDFMLRDFAASTKMVENLPLMSPNQNARKLQQKIPKSQSRQIINKVGSSSVLTGSLESNQFKSLARQQRDASESEYYSNANLVGSPNFKPPSTSQQRAQQPQHQRGSTLTNQNGGYSQARRIPRNSLSRKSGKQISGVTLHGQKSVRATLQLGIYEAKVEDREVVAGCADVLEQVLQAVEDGKSEVKIEEIEDADLQKNRNPLNQASNNDYSNNYYVGGSSDLMNNGVERRRPASLASQWRNDNQGQTSGQQQVSKRTQRLMEELEAKEKKNSRVLSPEQIKRRQAVLKEATEKREAQFRLLKERKDAQKKEDEEMAAKKDQMRLRAEKHRKNLLEKQRKEVELAKEKQKQEDQVKRQQEKAQSREKKAFANQKVQEMEEKRRQEIEAIKQKNRSLVEQRQKSIEAQMALPRISRKSTLLKSANSGLKPQTAASTTKQNQPPIQIAPQSTRNAIKRTGTGVSSSKNLAQKRTSSVQKQAQAQGSGIGLGSRRNTQNARSPSAKKEILPQKSPISAKSGGKGEKTQNVGPVQNSPKSQKSGGFFSRLRGSPSPKK